MQLSLENDVFLGKSLKFRWELKLSSILIGGIGNRNLERKDQDLVEP